MNIRNFIGSILLAGAMFGFLFFVKVAFVGNLQAGAAIPFSVMAGDTIGSIADHLASQQVIRYPSLYRVYGWIDSRAKRPIIGSYELHAGMSFRSLARLLSEGPERKEATATIIEGWTVDQEAAYLSDEKGVSSTATVALIGRSVDHAPFDPHLRSEFSFLRDLPPERSLEGYLFPETYRAWQDELPGSLVQKQLDEFKKRFGDATVGPDSAPLKTLDDVVVLASIIEKEVRDPKDRKIVAGIFLRRLKEGIGLQSDATLSYALGSGARATNVDLSSSSPYNTYKYRGLPPGPICNPSETAIDAVLHPTLTDYRYFLTDKNGNVLYAATLEEHIRNRQKAGYSN